MGIAGIPWWTTDIGGFHGGDPTDPAFQELLARWFQYGAFCPVMRLHGDRYPQQPQQGTTGGAPAFPARPTRCGALGRRDYEICKKYMFLRERLRPYIKEQMAAAHEKGTPVMRPLFYDFPADSAAWACEDAYLFGPSLLVAPVMEAGQRQRSVYLPAGAQWTHVWSGETYEGGQTVTVAAPLEEIPVFTREKGLLPLFGRRKVKFLLKLFSKSLRVVGQSPTALPLTLVGVSQRETRETGALPRLSGRRSSFPLRPPLEGTSPKGGGETWLPLWGSWHGGSRD